MRHSVHVEPGRPSSPLEPCEAQQRVRFDHVVRGGNAASVANGKVAIATRWRMHRASPPVATPRELVAIYPCKFEATLLSLTKTRALCTNGLIGIGGAANLC